MSFLTSEVNGALVSAALNPVFSGLLSNYGVTNKLCDQVWELIAQEHLNALLRARQFANPKETTLRQGQITVATGHLNSLREDLASRTESIWAAGDIDVNDDKWCPLRFWKDMTTMRGPGTAGASLANMDTECYRSVADTVRQMISRKCGTSGTERKVCDVLLMFDIDHINHGQQLGSCTETKLLTRTKLYES